MLPHTPTTAYIYFPPSTSLFFLRLIASSRTAPQIRPAAVKILRRQLNNGLQEHVIASRDHLTRPAESRLIAIQNEYDTIREPVQSFGGANRLGSCLHEK